MPTQVHDSNGPGPTYIKTVEQLITTTTSAFAFNGKECRSERQRAWHFIERHNTQVSWRSTKFAPSQIGPLQCEAVACSVSFCRGERRVRPPPRRHPPPPVLLESLELRPTEASEFPSSVPRGEVLSSSVPGKRTPVLPSSSSAPRDAGVAGSSGRILAGAAPEPRQGSCDREVWIAWNEEAGKVSRRHSEAACK